MKGLDVLLATYKVDFDPSVFNKVIEVDELSFFKSIIERLNRNAELKTTESFAENIHLLVLIFQQYPKFDGSEDVEEYLSVALSKAFCDFMRHDFHIDDVVSIKSLELFVDVFFHNPCFVNFLGEYEIEEFMIALVKLAKVTYDATKHGRMVLILEYSIAVFLYFPDVYIEKYKQCYLNHFDERIINEFIESY